MVLQKNLKTPSAIFYPFCRARLPPSQHDSSRAIFPVPFCKRTACQSCFSLGVAFGSLQNGGTIQFLRHFALPFWDRSIFKAYCFKTCCKQKLLIKSTVRQKKPKLVAKLRNWTPKNVQKPGCQKSRI